MNLLILHSLFGGFPAVKAAGAYFKNQGVRNLPTMGFTTVKYGV